MILFAAAATVLIGLSFGTARADCDATLPLPAALASLRIGSDYRSTLQLCKGKAARGSRSAACRSGRTRAAACRPPHARDALERAACWSCADARESDLTDTRMMRAIASAADTPGLAHRGFLANAGLTRGERGGGYFTGDLCPSSKPMDRDFLGVVERQIEPTPVALSISGLWLKHHFLTTNG